MIAQVELAVIAASVALDGEWTEHRDVIWFVDNSAAVVSVVSGKSKCESMDVAVENTHLMLMRVKIQVWFERVESRAKWSDGTSRTPLASPKGSHVGKFCARLGLGPSMPATRRSFVPPFTKQHAATVDTLEAQPQDWRSPLVRAAQRETLQHLS